MKMKRKILVIIRGFEKSLYFLRLNKALRPFNYQCIFVVDHFNSYIYLKYNRCNVYLVRNLKKENRNKIDYPDKDIKNTVEYYMDIYSLSDLKKIYLNMFFLLEEINKKEHLDYIFFWNGTSIFDLAGKCIAKKYNIKTIFFEIANIPNKVFVDKLGTNAYSELYHNKSILNNFNVEEKEYYSWKQSYLRNKLKHHIIPQSKKSNKEIKMNYFNIIIVLCAVFLREIGYDYKNLKNKIKKRIKLLNKKNIIYKYDVVDYKLMKYIFFPLQVSNDSQILIHSDISLMDAILYAIKEAKEKNLELIIKPHPAEHNQEIFNEICKLKEKHKFYFINDNTFKLIKYAKKVITINSTVGLEAKICGKEVEILGRAFYKNFTEEDLRRYILGYLVNIDYFSDKEISKEAIKELEKRMY